MKKVISALTAAAMCASMSASVMTAFAAYSANDVTMYLKAIETSAGTISEDGKTVTFATAADAANAKIVVQSFVTADTDGADVIGAGVVVTSDSSAITFSDGVDFAAASGTDKNYALTDGTAFSTDMFAHCFGEVFKQGKKFLYDSNTGMTVAANSNSWDFWTGNNALVFKWAANIEAADVAGTNKFMDTVSDTFPFYQFTANLGEIADGTYTVSYLGTWENPNLAEPLQSGTYVTSFDNTQTVVPGTGLTIVVGDPNAATEPPATEPPATEPPATEPPATEPENPTDPPETPSISVEPQDPSKFDKETLYFENVVYDRNSEDGGVEMEIKVAKNQPTNGITTKFLVNGQEPGTIFDGLTAKSMGTNGFTFTMQALDPATGGIACARNPVMNDDGKTANVDASQKTLADGDVVYTIWIDIPEDFPTGVYTFSFENDQVKLTSYPEEERMVAGASGTLTITDGAEVPTEPTPTEPTPTEPTPTEPTPTEPTPTEPTPTEPPAPGSYLYGDVNKNNKVELVDIVMLNRFLTGFGGQTLDEYQTVVANCYRDNGESDADTKQSDLNSKDSMEILKHLIGLVATLPTNA